MKREMRKALEANVHGGYLSNGRIDGERTAEGSAGESPLRRAGARDVEGGDGIRLGGLSYAQPEQAHQCQDAVKRMFFQRRSGRDS